MLSIESDKKWPRWDDIDVKVCATGIKGIEVAAFLTGQVILAANKI